MTVDGRMQLTVLGGFLGAGKTTWLRHRLRHGAFRDALVVINESADVSVDDLLLADAAAMAVLAGGCACCEALDRLISLLRAACDARVSSDRLDAGANHVLLETSGLADPGRIVEAVRRDPVLVHHIVIGEIVVVADAIHGLDHLRSEPLGRQQIEVADRIVVAKVDAVDQHALKRLLATLRLINPAAEISGAMQGAAHTLPPFAGVVAEPLPELGGGAGRSPIVATTLRIDGPVDWTAFGVWLSALLHARGDDVVRVKGVVRTPAGRLLLQSVRRVVQRPEILPDNAAGEDNAVVVIGRGYAPNDLSRSLSCFASTHSS